MKGTFKFHPVGRGQFYTGNIQYDDTKKEINFIYDIGTKGKYSVIKDKVTQYCEYTRKVDFLILSHLHEDHTKGLCYLLNSKVQIGAIVMPYLRLQQRKLIYQRALYDWQDLFISGGLYSFPYIDFIHYYYDFIRFFYLDPYYYIRDKKPDCKVIFYSTDEISEIEQPNNDNYRLEPLSNSEDALLNSFLEAEYVVKKSRGNLFSISPRKSTEIVYKDWIFDIRQPGFNQDNQEKMNKIVRGLLNKKSNDDYVDTILNIIKNANIFLKNKDCITLEHHPSRLEPKSCRTLLTGDYDDEEIYKESGLLSQGKEYFVIQIPHHGSKVNKDVVINSKTEYSVVCHMKEDPTHPYDETLKAFGKISNNPIQHITEYQSNYFEYEYDDRINPTFNAIHESNDQ